MLVARALAEAGLPTPARGRAARLPRGLRGRLPTTRALPRRRGALARLGGCTLAVLTNKPGDMSRAILEGLGVAARFARICGRRTCPRASPIPAGLRWLMAEAGAGPGDTAMVGDSPVDVRTGRAAGAPDRGRLLRPRPRGPARRAARRLLDDLRELRSPTSPGPLRVCYADGSPRAADRAQVHGQHPRLGKSPRDSSPAMSRRDHDPGRRHPGRAAGRAGATAERPDPRRPRAPGAERAAMEAWVKAGGTAARC